ncbi:transposase [Bacillus thuringiensis]|uniref:transposase n=1 Tax=Bacillus thuringiensis TaxID=1428 RepID=UPI003A8A2EDE
MGKIRVTYDVEFKKKAIDLYLKEGMSYKNIAKELGIHHSVVSRWVKYFEAILEMLEKGYTISLLCAIAGVTRSGYISGQSGT